MRITDFMVDRPCTVICISYFLLLVFAVITGAAGYMMPSLEGGRNRDYLIWKHPLQVDKDTLDLADEFIRDTSGDAKVELQSETTNQIFILYSNEGDHKNGLLNAKSVIKMNEMEQALLTNEKYKKFCLAEVREREEDPLVC